MSKGQFGDSSIWSSNQIIPDETDPSKIRKYVDEIAEYYYKKAVKINPKGTALAMSRGVQNRYQTILKGAALIDD
ncbi:uncharacterized protein N7484_005285 [Penicillium longicatenatum]|uniref:uncharacterized protein n=1 Tax=Penicillium longicatenatum TaxID=1561947 RepID=UPI002547ADCF|nr:uncharacterized protein N7484_005285 [Penicillium longicatenatum]KAJ5651562.1 hypothetical protein N7484_005285 [Penicillium longicatenatum]